MIEPQLEALDDNFPEGWVVAYIGPQGEIRVARGNSDRRFALDLIYNILCKNASSVQVEHIIEEDSGDNVEEKESEERA